MNQNDLRLTAGKRAIVRREVDALETALAALTPLDFSERRRVLRWVCDYYQIDPTKLGLP